MRRILLIILILAVIVLPVYAVETKAITIGKAVRYDTPVTAVEKQPIATADRSNLYLDAGKANWQIGRLWVNMTPNLLVDVKGTPIENKMLWSSTDMAIQYDVFTATLKEQVALQKPTDLSYTYTIGLTDWQTWEPVDMTNPNSSYHWVTTYAKDSSWDINLKPNGDISITINGAETVVLPKPTAIGADGKQYDLSYRLDKAARQIEIVGDLSTAKYPVVVDPTEYLSNTGFETGTTDPWIVRGPHIISGGCHSGSYGLFQDNTTWGNTYSINQSITATSVKTVRSWWKATYAEMAVYLKLNSTTIDSFVVPPTLTWTLETTSSISSTGPKNLTFAFNETSPAGAWVWIDDISATDEYVLNTSFTKNQTAGWSPLPTAFTDTSTGAPRVWNWTWECLQNGSIVQFSTAQNPTQVFTSPVSVTRNYSIVLNTWNYFGSNITVNNTAWVNVTGLILPVPSFTQNQTSGTTSVPVQFTDGTVTTPTAWTWTWWCLQNTTSNLFSTVQNPVQEFDAPNGTIRNFSITHGGYNASGWNYTADYTAWVNVTGSTAVDRSTTAFVNAREIHDVEIIVRDGHGNTLSGVHISATANSTTSATGWLQSIWQLPESYDPTTTMTGVTDSGGSVTFPMIGVGRYWLTFTDTSRGINEAHDLYPSSTSYSFVLNYNQVSTTGWTANISCILTNTSLSPTVMRLGYSFTNTTKDVDSFDFFVNTTTGTPLWSEHYTSGNPTVTSGGYNALIGTNESFVWGVKVHSTSFGWTNFTNGMTIPHSLGIDQGIGQWIALALVVFIGAMFSVSNVKFGAIIVPIVLFGCEYAWGLFTLSPEGNGIVFVMLIIGVLFYIRQQQEMYT